MGSNKKFHAFISYSHKDKAYAASIQKLIEKLGIPFYRSWQTDVNIFRDERKIPLAGSLTEQIIAGLKESEHLIVIASKNSANSTWVREEILNWYQLNQDENGYITNFNFILTDDVIEWDYQNHDFDKLKTTALPSFERRMFKELPLWANLQLYCKAGKVLTKNSNYEWEIAKIKGLLLGKRPDEVIDEVSKGKRLFRITGGVVISILIALSGLAFYLREIAEKERDAALNNLIKFKIEEFNRNMKNGNTFLDAEAYYLADSLFTLALTTARNKTFRTSIAESNIHYLDSISIVCKKHLQQK